MYMMLRFTIKGFDEFEFSRIFFLLILSIKNCEKIRTNILQGENSKRKSLKWLDGVMRESSYDDLSNFSVYSIIM